MNTQKKKNGDANSKACKMIAEVWTVMGVEAAAADKFLFTRNFPNTLGCPNSCSQLTALSFTQLHSPHDLQVFGRHLTRLLYRLYRLTACHPCEAPLEQLHWNSNRLAFWARSMTFWALSTRYLSRSFGEALDRSAWRQRQRHGQMAAVETCRDVPKGWPSLR